MPTFDLTSFSHILIAHNGRYFRFKRGAEQALECHVCYWKGCVIASDQTAAYKAYVEQKYAPYRKIWAEGVFDSKQAALQWVAAQLSQEPE